MAELKTKKNDADVADFLNRIEDEKKRIDSWKIVTMLQEITGDEPAMWGDSIVGFGQYSYTYQSGHSGEWMIVGFSPRKQNLTVYIMSGFESYKELMKKLGKFKIGKSCLYLKKLDDIDIEVFRKLIKKSVEYMKNEYK